MGRRRRAGLVCLAFALLGRLSAPAWPGFWLPPLAMGLFFLADLAGWRADWAALTSPGGRAGLRLLAGLLVGLMASLAAGQVAFGPAWDFSGRQVALAPETQALLARLDRPATITVSLGSQDPRFPWIREMLEQFRRAAGAELTVVFLNPQLEAEPGETGPSLAFPGSALISTDTFRERAPALTEEALSRTFRRLLTTETRLVYFLYANPLNSENPASAALGAKTVQDSSFGGLSQWAEDMGARRLLALDYHWGEGAPLPAGASALVLAGPRAPLGEGRERLLLDYLSRGGRLLIMADPLTAALSQDFWKHFGLKYPDGLAVDPEASLAGTSELFLVSRDYPGHSLTRGLSRPILWPLAGAFLTDEGARAPGVVYALAQSSPSSWLQLDPAAAGRGDLRYVKGRDVPGPLALAVALRLDEGGGRLAALADSDLAANGFRGFPGNRAFGDAVLDWLLDEQAGAPAGEPAGAPAGSGQDLILSGLSARLAFWGPVAVWPSAALGVWFFFYNRRRKGS